MKRRGKLIVFEGADGIGKTTQTRLLAEGLKARGYRTAFFSFPRYGSTLGDVINDLLHRSERVWRVLDWRARGLLFAADRMAALPELSRALARCDFVCLDRYVESNAAYLLSEARTSADARARAAWVSRLEYDTLGLPRPDVTVLLELAPKLAQRLIRKERQADVNETLRYQRRLQRAYRLSADPRMSRLRVSASGDHTRVLPPDNVHARVVHALVRANILPGRLLKYTGQRTMS
ncbi:MAG: dTMP kinase [bacterium]|nr:dTMP kinase [bacterium]